VRGSTLFLIAGGSIAARAVRWRDPNLWRTFGGIYRDPKAGLPPSSLHEKLAGPVAFVLIIIGAYLALSGN
jgi:hypothetical protein